MIFELYILKFFETIFLENEFFDIFSFPQNFQSEYFSYYCGGAVINCGGTGMNSHCWIGEGERHSCPSLILVCIEWNLIQKILILEASITVASSATNKIVFVLLIYNAFPITLLLTTPFHGSSTSSLNYAHRFSLIKLVHLSLSLLSLVFALTFASLIWNFFIFIIKCF